MNQPSDRSNCIYQLSGLDHIDLLCDQFEAEYQRGQKPRIEDYLALAREGEEERLFRELVNLEMALQRRDGQPANWEDYQKRFPDRHLPNEGALELTNAFIGQENDKKYDIDMTTDGQLEPGDHAAAKIPADRLKQIGPYRLLQLLGEGGMGAVWMADQEKPVRRRVALKLIKAGLDNKQIIARFEAERQALAMMDHQNIAKVLDAGATEDGLPYFVMELVQGVPFNQYCNQKKLSINERLELFIPVCEAIQHAHQKGIIHRDLKPSNVLVCLYDGQPVAKVIDFGLAKALQHTQKLTDKTLFTEFGQVVGTLQYMSPEQAEMNQLDIDTRTDIYSLGVMLYELLTGSTPIEADSLKHNAFLQVLATIREQDPPRPSVRLSSATNEAVSGISAQRQIDPAKLKSILRGELDWIVMKALEKDRTRRYETANAFAADVANYLNGNVVTARPPSTGYRLKKYVRRHRGLVASLVSIATLLVIATIGTSWLAIRANQARKLADEKTLESKAEKEKAESEQKRANEEAHRATQALEQNEATTARSNYFSALEQWEVNNVAEANAFLDRIPMKFRKFEWYLARRHFRGGYATLYGHLGPVTSVDFSPDGKLIASGSTDTSVKIWDATTGQEMRTLWGDSGEISSVAFDPKGSRFVSASITGAIKVWDVTVGKEILTLAGHSSSVTSASFSPDGKRIISSAIGRIISSAIGGRKKVRFDKDDTIKLWDATTGEHLQTFVGHTDAVEQVTFSPDGTKIASASSDSTVKLWDVGTGQVKHTLEGGAGAVRSVAFSPDGMRIATGGNDVKLWDVNSGEAVRTHTGSSASVASLDFSPDGRLITFANSDGTMSLLDLTVNSNRLIQVGLSIAIPKVDKATKDVQFAQKGTEHYFTSVAFSPDSTRIVTANNDHTVKLWDATDVQGSGWHPEPDRGSWRNDVFQVAFGQDGSQITATTTSIGGGTDALKRTCKLWDTVSGNELCTLQLQSEVSDKSELQFHSFSPNGKYVLLYLSRTPPPLVAEADRWILFDASTGLTLRTFRDDFSAVSYDGGRPTPGWGLSRRAVSSDGTKTATFCDDGRVKLLDTLSGKPICVLRGFMNATTSLAFSIDGTKIATASVDGPIKLWDALTGQELNTLQGSPEEVTSLSISPDGTRIASGLSDNTIKIWDATTGQQLIVLKGHSGPVSSIAFSPDGERMISASLDGTIKLWDATPSMHEPRNLRDLFEGFDELHFSPDGKRIVSYAYNGSIILWDTDSLQEVARLWNSHYVPPNANSIPLDIHSEHNFLEIDYIYIHDPKEPVLVTNRPLRNEFPARLAFSPDGSKIVLKDPKSGLLKLWDSLKGNELNTLEGLLDLPRGVSFSQDGTRIMGASFDKLILWETFTGKKLCIFDRDSFQRDFMLFALSADGKRIVSEDGEGTIKLWDTSNGLELYSRRPSAGTTDPELGSSELFSGLAFSPDGGRLALKSNQRILLCDANSGQELRTLVAGSRFSEDVFGSGVAFSTDGSRVYSYSNTELLRSVWDAETGALLQPIPQVSPGTYITPDGRWMMFASGDKVELIDREIGRQPYEKALRKSMVTNRYQWHRRQAEMANLYGRQAFATHAQQESEAEIFAELFHRAWVMKADPDRAASFDELHKAHQIWMKLNSLKKAKQEQSSPQTPSQPLTESAQTSNRPEPVLPSIVIEMLQLPRGQEVSVN